MTDNSLLKGTTWYWRQGAKHVPIGGDSERVLELSLKIEDITDGGRILDELNKNGIRADIKNTHSYSDHIPAHCLIVYSSISQLQEDKEKEENLQKLEKYIIEKGGKIGNGRPKPPQSLFGLFKRFFYQERK